MIASGASTLPHPTRPPRLRAALAALTTRLRWPALAGWAASLAACAPLPAEVAPSAARPEQAQIAASAIVLPDFDSAETARILAHGPWPPAPRRDPTNRVSGLPAAIELGRRLFFDPALSADGRIACAGCHDAARGFTDGLARARGLARHDRNTQGLANVARQRWFGWDGGADSLWAATIRPLLAAGEMGSSPARVAAHLRADPALVAAYTAAFGHPPGSAASLEETLLVDAAKAIAAYLETMVSPRTPFDAFRDALARGDAAGVARYPSAARRGLRIFVGRGRCHVCHFGPEFSNGEFHDVGRPFLLEGGRVDPGRFAGIRRVRGDRFNLLGVHNDERATGAYAQALKTTTVSQQHRNWGEWRTPSLRGLGATAPYMHDGSLATLREVVQHYSELDEDRLHTDGEALLAPLRLADGEIDDLLAFLRTLDPDAPAAAAGGR